LCNVSVMDFFVRHCTTDEFKSKRILEVGSKCVNGSVRPFIERYLLPGEYVGTDIEAGMHVDRVVPAERLAEVFGHNSFDVVVCTEVLEHIKDWRTVIDNIKAVVKPGGCVYLTTCSYCFPYHGYPYDFWRFEPQDLRAMMADFDVVASEKDPAYPGVFIKARKPRGYVRSVDLSEIALYSIIVGKRTTKILDVNDMLSLRKMLVNLSKTPLWSYVPWSVKRMTF
jgi:SAM-dependent methyltransferase